MTGFAIKKLEAENASVTDGSTGRRSWVRILGHSQTSRIQLVIVSSLYSVKMWQFLSVNGRGKMKYCVFPCTHMLKKDSRLRTYRYSCKIGVLKFRCTSKLFCLFLEKLYFIGLINLNI